MHPWLDIRIPIGSPLIDDDRTRSEFKKRLGQAIRSCRQGHATQDEISERTGIGQSTLSAYENGKSVPDALQMYDIEMACGRPAGWIAVRSGLVADVTSVVDALQVDPGLTDATRDLVRSYYEGAIKGLKDAGVGGDDAL